MDDCLPLSASALAGRQRAALAAVCQAFAESIAQHVPVAVDAFEKELIELATEAEAPADRERCRDALLKLGDAAEQLRASLTALVEDALARIDVVPPPSGIAATDASEQRELEALATRLRDSAGDSLAVLGERLGALAGVAFDDFSTPLGPWRLAELLRRGAQALELDVALRPSLYLSLERVWLVNVPELYEDVNALLKRARSLLKLPEAAAPAAAPADTFDFSAFDRPLQGWPLVGLPHRGLAEAQDNADSDLDLRLRARLAATAEPARAGGDAPAPHASLLDVDRALAALQKKPAQPLMLGGRLVARTVAHVRQDLLIQLRELASDGRPARLGAAEQETIEIVARLFDALLADAPPNAPAQTVLPKLQVPILRAALLDPGFFTRRAHPARQFLGAIAESALEWVLDEPDDRPAVDRLDALATRALAEYKGDASVFDKLLDDYAASHLASVRKVQIAERRNIEAARGREKLDLARRDATADIGKRLASGRATPLVRAVLEDAWTRVVAMTLMREPAGSPGHVSRLALAERLIESLGPGRPPLGLDEETFLRREIEIGLGKIGYHAGDVQLLAERLFSDDAAAHDDVSLATIGAPRASGARESEEIAISTTASPLERRVVERLVALPAGTWIDVAIDRGRVARRRLAWASAASGRCLVVDTRGARVEEPSLDALARAVVEGTVRVVPERGETIVDRALRAL